MGLFFPNHLIFRLAGVSIGLFLSHGKSLAAIELDGAPVLAKHPQHKIRLVVLCIVDERFAHPFRTVGGMHKEPRHVVAHQSDKPHHAVCVFGLGHNVGLYTTTGKAILPCEYDKIDYYMGNYKLWQGKHVGICTTTGKAILPCEYDKIDYRMGNYLVRKNQKQGLYRSDGKEILPCKYQKIDMKSGMWTGSM